MYKSQLKKIDPYDWFCGPGSHIIIIIIIIYFFTKYKLYSFWVIWIISMCILRNDAVLRHGCIITSLSNDITASFSNNTTCL